MLNIFYRCICRNYNLILLDVLDQIDDVDWNDDEDKSIETHLLLIEAIPPVAAALVINLFLVQLIFLITISLYYN